MSEDNFLQKLKAFFHDPVDKCIDIITHENRAKKYAGKFGITGINEAKGPDMISSCMERSLLPKQKIYQNFSEVRHPLCEKKIDVSQIDKNEISGAVEKTYEKISDFVQEYDEKTKFFYLWRNLLEELLESSGGKSWAKYLSVLPADTRVPDHSIWEHLKITSALSAWWDKKENLLYQNNLLFLFTIGPVQSFISQARKTQDFYMGSFILSFLTFKAMEVIIDRYGPTNIIYPDLYKQPLMDWWMKGNLEITPKGYNEIDLLLPTITNRFVAIIPETKYEKIKNLVDEMREKIRKILNPGELESAINIVLQNLKLNDEITDEVKEKIGSQLCEFPEIYWVAIPWKIGSREISHDDLREFFEEEVIQQHKKLWEFSSEYVEEGRKRKPKYVEYFPNIGLLYELIYSSLEKSMGARKNIRKFEQHKVEEKGRKCTVCAERDVIFFNESRNKRKFTLYNEIYVDLAGRIDYKFLADGEGLCAICFLKRTFEVYLREKVSPYAFKDLSFPSTSEISCADWKEKAVESAEEEFKAYKRKLKEVLRDRFQKVNPLPKLKEKLSENPDGHFFYEENLSVDYFKKEIGIEVGEKDINELRKLLNGIYEKIGRPNSYYAIIHLDADDMGKWLSGELLPDIKYAYNSETWEIMERERRITLNDKEISFTEALMEYLPKRKNGQARKMLTPAIHASISTALRNYALEFVRKVVEEEHLGKLVYAGGDDVLAFVNLKELLDVMNKLRWSFSGCIKIEDGKIKVISFGNGELNECSGFVEKDGNYILTMGPNATASAGIVIAHYKTPLQIIIRKVFEMEEKAKSNGKDAFAICLMRRSGEERGVKAKWSYDNEDGEIRRNKKINTIELIERLVDIFDEKNESGYIAKGFIQKVENNFIHLKDREGNFIGTADIFEKELYRLIQRSYNEPKGEKINKEEKKIFIKTAHELMETLFKEMGENINDFLNICRIAVFMLKAED